MFISSMCGEAVCCVRRSLRKTTIGVFFGDSVVHFHSQIRDILNLPVDKQMPWELPCSFLPSSTSM